MRPKPSPAIWIGSAFCTALALAAATVGVLGANEKGTIVALGLTARLSFLLFWLAYAGGALAALFGSRFEPLKQRSREFGLAFASAHLVHIGLVAWLCRIGDAPSVSTFIFFGIALVWTYLLALFSIDRLRQALSPTHWWLLRTVGLNYIAYAFAFDFLNDPFRYSVKHMVAYLPFAILSIAGPFLRLAAWRLRGGHIWPSSSYLAR
jgi:hypothetical protein